MRRGALTTYRIQSAQSKLSLQRRQSAFNVSVSAHDRFTHKTKWNDLGKTEETVSDESRAKTVHLTVMPTAFGPFPYLSNPSARGAELMLQYVNIRRGKGRAVLKQHTNEYRTCTPVCTMVYDPMNIKLERVEFP